MAIDGLMKQLLFTWGKWWVLLVGLASIIPRSSSFSVRKASVQLRSIVPTARKNNQG